MQLILSGHDYSVLPGKETEEAPQKEKNVDTEIKSGFESNQLP